MLAEAKLKTFLELVQQSSKEELLWMSGYLAGHTSSSAVPAAAPAPQAAPPAVGKVTIAYGTETGNSKRVATDLAGKAKKSGINARVVSLDQYRVNDLEKEEYFLTVISTQGEGDPPAGAQKFYDYVHQTDKKLPKLKYSVLALGDTSYPLFCKAGEDVDAQLQRLGGRPLVPIQKCDVDYEDEANAWFQSVLQTLNQTATPASAPAPAPAKKGGKKIYNGTILSNIILNDVGSNKFTHHIEIEAEDLAYEPGDALGVVPKNRPFTVEAILRITGISPEEKVTHRNSESTVRELLHDKLNITFLPERVVKKYAEAVEQDIPATRIDLLDLLRIYPVKDAEQFKEVLQILEPIAPRLYSISSSLEAHTGEVHVTVARDEFRINEELLCGHCSDYLSEQKEGQPLEFYIHKNSQFKLPAPDKDVIMIGPGTGVAPFRSFLAERDATGAEGRNWLFFGDQHFATDFLYQTEIQSWFETGTLTKFNGAFSRDQQEKVYVQHKMQENATAFYEWLTSGAYVYVCGAKEPMSVDVENTLLQIIGLGAGSSPEEAAVYLEQLKEEGRYLKDVY
ncbi:sulfite reductase flavoprotein subunit alpha [Rufibacter glacialis]|uniref:assimilatory sulfite reductase (NADPH) n=1 Tax=Rufibacter glacialis TaxID=1259555 RepID=A0A5M8QLA6_9BACT|nr:flavodoxin domain-containing protein [Rufibacter glacialis]KAA6435433.1 sulfite reductase [Rufibacter glacialis]GGK63385.1 sulfite reductase [NADPH] flavoprotein alpha-component [Rufibacter glacialis]